jgi:bacterioferritin
MADSNATDYLNAVLKDTLTAINQYFLHARILKHQNHLTLADQEYKASIDAMKHSDMLVEHTLSLGGLPNLGALNILRIGNTPAEMLDNDLILAEASLLTVKESILSCERQGKLASIPLLLKLLCNHQERIDTLKHHITSHEPQQKDCA